MFIFGTADMGGTGTRGAYKEMWLSGKNGKGSALVVNNSSYPSGGANDKYFVTNVAMTQKERYSIVQCFDDKNYIYAFGHDPASSMITVGFMAFLGRCDSSGTDGDGFQRLLALYSNTRITKYLKPVKVKLGGALTLLEGYVVGMSTSTANAEFNLQGFEMNIIVPKAIGGTN